MSASCCCDDCLFDFPCCGPCWFPVAQHPSRIDIPNPLDPNSGTVVGPPSEITGYYQESINSAPVYAAQIYTQNDASFMYVKKRYCYDRSGLIQGQDFVWTFTGCAFYVPCRLDWYEGSEYNLVSSSNVIVTITISPDGWRVLNFANIQNPGLVPFDPNQCNGFFSQQGEEVTVNGGTGATYIEFNVSGGLPFPDGFVCGSNGLFRRPNSILPFRGPRSSVPPEFFPLGI